MKNNEKQKIEKLLRINNEIKELENQINVKKTEEEILQESVYEILEKNDIEKIEYADKKIKRAFYVDGKIKKTSEDEKEIEKIKKIIDYGYASSISIRIELDLKNIETKKDIDKYIKLKKEIEKNYNNSDVEDVFLNFSINFMKLRSILTNEYKEKNKQERKKILEDFEANFYPKIKITEKKEIKNGR